MFIPFDKNGNREEEDKLFLELASSYIINTENPSIYETVGTLSNLASLLWWYLEDINWAGFYLYDGEKLVLGPFQGDPACFEIALSRGVCGAAASSKQTVIVPEVEKFPGHIACSSASRSEIVVPVLRKDGSLFGVIDIDSPIINRFSKEDARLLEQLSRMIIA